MGMIPYLTQWGESSYFGIFKGLCFSDGGLFGFIDEDGDICEFTDKEAAVREYEGVIAEMRYYVANTPWNRSKGSGT